MSNNRSSARNCFWINPRDLLFTQADIKSTFTDPTLPSVRETASLIRRGLLNTAVFGPLLVSIDEQRRFWCGNNRRLFALREAGVSSIYCVGCGNQYPAKSLKEKLSDPAFMPKIRGEASCLQIPQPSNFHRMQREPSKLSPVVNVSAAYLNRQLYNSHEDEDEEDELAARFNQLDIKFTSTYPSRNESASSGKWGEVSHNVFTQTYDYIPSNFDPSDFENPNRRLYKHKEAEDDSAPVGLYGNCRGKNVVESKPNNLSFVTRISGGASGVRIPPPPTSGRNGYQMEKRISVSAGYSERELYRTHVEQGVHYREENVEVEYEYTVPYEVEGGDDEEYVYGMNGYEDEGECEYTGASEGKYEYEFDNPVQYEEGKYEYSVEYEYPVASGGFPDEGEDIVEYPVQYEYPVASEGFPHDGEDIVEYPVQYDYPVASEGFPHDCEDIMAHMNTYFEVHYD